MHSPSIPIYIYIYIYRKIAARCTTRLARSRSPITGAAHTVIPIQRQHAHKIATSVYQCTRDRYRSKMRLASERKKRHDYPDADRARRAAQSSQATENCRGSETAEARERRDRDRRKRRIDSESAETRISSETLSTRLYKQRIDDLAIIHVSSCNDVIALQKMSLATFHVHVLTITCLLLRMCL